MSNDAEKQHKIDILKSLGVGTLAATALHLHDKRLPLSTQQKLLRKGILGAGVAGLGFKITNAFQRNKLKQERQAEKLASNFYYDNTGVKDFVKTAASIMGDEAYVVPTKYAYNAYLLYNSLPDENREETTVALYNSVTPGMDKVAMKLVAANVLKENHLEKTAGILSSVSTLGKNLLRSPAVKQFGKTTAEGATRLGQEVGKNAWHFGAGVARGVGSAASGAIKQQLQPYTSKIQPYVANAKRYSRTAYNTGSKFLKNNAGMIDKVTSAAGPAFTAGMIYESARDKLNKVDNSYYQYNNGFK